MIDERFVILGAIIGLVGTMSYLIDTLKGKIQPNKATWLLWALAPFLAFGAQLQQGVGIRSLMSFSVGFSPFLIFLASFINKKAYWKLGKIDYLCAGFSALGLILWAVTKVGNIAILFAILADGLAAIPTIIKSWKAPETENYKVFLFGTINSGITLLTIKVWNFANSAFPIYIFLICVLFVILIKFKLGKLFRESSLSVYK